ncbi:MAG: hybrid sensor histidine kinase/response regulator [Desulfarculaceae bacterium]|jgi:signal transduction histidine kinase
MAGDTQDVKVLLVDDEAEFRQILARRLERRGFAVDQAGSGAEALAALASSPGALVVADVKMPGMDGLELLQRIKAGYPDIEVILLTGRATVDDGVAGLKAGAFDYLTKPVEAEHLASKLRQAAERAQSRREREREAAYRLQMADRLAAAERLASLGTLAAGVAHEINNPLAIIKEAAGWLARRLAKNPGLAPETRQDAELALEKIEAGVDRARRITHQLLGFARKSEWDIRELDAARILSEAVELVRPVAAQHGVELESQIGVNGLALWADPQGLRQILVNLLTNAVQASPLGGKVTAGVGAAGDEAVFTVTDQGPGIPQESRARIFEPFYTTKAPDQGAGLGLSVCQGLAGRMGGRLEVDSQVGAGATFRLAIPTRPPLPDRLPERALAAGVEGEGA